MTKDKYIIESDKTKFQRLLASSVISSVITLLVGIVMLVFTKLTNNIIGLIVGLSILSVGVSTIYKFIKRDGAKLYSYNLVFGILLSILGIFIIISPEVVANSLAVALGIFLIIVGANKISYGVWFKIGNDASWSITLVIGILLILFGIVVITNPFSSLTVTKLVGIFLIISSVLDLTTYIMLKKRSKEVTKIFW